jgi:hypothetical protein
MKGSAGYSGESACKARACRGDDRTEGQVDDGVDQKSGCRASEFHWSESWRVNSESRRFESKSSKSKCEFLAFKCES